MTHLSADLEYFRKRTEQFPENEYYRKAYEALLKSVECIDSNISMVGTGQKIVEKQL